MDLLCTFKKILFTDNETGISKFLVGISDSYLSDTGLLLCSGIIPDYFENTPLELEGTLETQKDGRKMLTVTSCTEKATSAIVALHFLQSARFKGVGEQTAKRIVEIVGTDIFSFVANEKEAVNSLALVKGFSEKNARAFVKKVRAYTSA